MILGEFKRELHTQKLSNIPCESCGAEELYVKVFSKFFVLGLPAFPTGKAIEIQCSQCKKHNHFNYKTQKSAADRIQRIIDESKHKWYSYLLLIILGIGSVFVLINNTDEFMQEMGIKPKTIAPIYKEESLNEAESINAIKIESTDEITIEETEIITEAPESRYLQLTYATSNTPQHEAARFLLTLLNTDITANNNKGFELEAESNGKRLLLVCYVPNINKSTKKAKEELLSFTTSALQKKFGYTEFYLAFYGYDMSLYAIKSGNYTAVAHLELDYPEENRLNLFYME